MFAQLSVDLRQEFTSIKQIGFRFDRGFQLDARASQIALGGKPYTSIPAYTVIAYELTILFGGLLTVFGLFRLGNLGKYKLHPAYSARFSAEDFGLVVDCKDRDVPEVEALMRDYHAMEVSLVEG